MLTQQFFNRKTETVAQELLGKVLVRKDRNKIISGIIVETEAYLGPHDLAAHSAKGKTPRTEVMFGPPGCWYVYLIYGMYYCLNIVTRETDHASAVLFRAVEPLEGIDYMKKNRHTDNIHNLCSGPGKLCQAFSIDKIFNGISATSAHTNLYIEDQGIKIPKTKIIKAKRIGVDYAGEWKDKLLRYYIKDNTFVSKK